MIWKGIYHMSVMWTKPRHISCKISFRKIRSCNFIFCEREKNGTNKGTEISKSFVTLKKGWSTLLGACSDLDVWLGAGWWYRCHCLKSGWHDAGHRFLAVFSQVSPESLPYFTVFNGMEIHELYFTARHWLALVLGKLLWVISEQVYLLHWLENRILFRGDRFR